MEANKRGVKVQVILDKSQRTEKYSSATFFQNEGIPTFVDEIHGLAHNKVMVIDGRIVITGSFNFTKAAEAVVEGVRKVSWQIPVGWRPYHAQNGEGGSRPGRYCEAGARAGHQGRAAA
jgi:hypothetical protein